ncbi:WD REPEATS REGION domain-containing protein [Citrus sinensis]|nr:WD REPEATS REGION domain-containing protein [Citrus sinensis]
MDHQSRLSRLLETDWYSPRRLLGSPTDFDFQDAYRQKVAENLNLDSEGKPFRMLVFRGSPKSRRKSYRLIDELRREDAEALRNSTEQIQRRRQLPKKEARILDAPNLRNDYYSNMMDWGRNNILAIALGLELYLWKQENGEVQKLLKVTGEDDFPTSISWSQDAKTLAVGYMASKLQLWDAETSKLIRNLEGHDKRVATASWNHWNGHILTSGSQDKSIINHDVRVSNNVTSRINAHTAEVCGLKWSNEGNLLASGGDDNLVHVWDHSKMSSSKCLHRFRDHRAAVKALAWCPYQFNVLASGGGTQDGCIKIWNVQKDLWTRVEQASQRNIERPWLQFKRGWTKIMLVEIPSHDQMGRITASNLQNSRAFPAAADETLRFWEAFGPSGSGDFVSHLDGLLSLKADWLVNSRLLVKGTAVASRL